MKVTNEKIENRQAFLSIEMEPAEVEESLEKSYHRLVKKMNIPGFRKGKAPRAVVERHPSRERLLEEALGELNNKVVYVGGAVVSLYVNDPAAEEPRPTKDIDLLGH